MITLRNLSLRQGEKLLLDRANASFTPGARVGVVGANGCGKSTLFAVLAGERQADGGEVEMPPRLTLSAVKQEIAASDIPVIEFVLDGDVEFRAAQAEIVATDQAADGLRLAQAHERFHAIDGWAARARAAAILDGLGVAAADHQRAVREFSGGWRMRVNLARALTRRADLLLLDEPTNHLDLDAVLWLERWLSVFRGTLFLISHDRELLDGTTTEILHFHSARLSQYTGNYEAFEKARSMALSQQSAAYKRQQEDVARLHAFIERFRAKASKARQAQSRLKALERMELIARAHIDSPCRFQFRDPEASPDPVLQLEDCSAAYGGQTVLDDINLTLSRTARYGLLGRNGAGKSTLIRLIAGQQAFLQAPKGSRREGKGLRIGYFAQHQLEALDLDASPLLHLMRLDRGVKEQILRDYLGGFAFQGNAALEPVGKLSGGEKARLALALLIWQRPNLLLLDEPTNHLDIDMREALTEALQGYNGALVLVSHDRHLLRTTCEDFLLVSQGQVRHYDGDLEDYRQALASAAPKQEAAGNSGRAAPDRKAERRKAAETRQLQGRLRRPIEMRIASIEAELAQLNGSLAALDTRLACQETYVDGSSDGLRQALVERTRLEGLIQQLESEWLEQQVQLEALGVGL